MLREAQHCKSYQNVDTVREYMESRKAYKKISILPSLEKDGREKNWSEEI